MNSQEKILKEIEEYADRSHGNQMRKYAPDRYIVHPKRVMENCLNHTDDITVLAAALLHDVLEDTPVKQKEMRAFLETKMSAEQADKTMKLVVDLTDVYIKKDYPRLNRKARKKKELERLKKTHPDSQTIKYADIIDNAKEIITADPDFAKVFLNECRVNLEELDKGNPQLYKEAVAIVQEGLKAVI